MQHANSKATPGNDWLTWCHCPSLQNDCSILPVALALPSCQHCLHRAGVAPTSSSPVALLPLRIFPFVHRGIPGRCAAEGLEPGVLPAWLLTRVGVGN